MRCVAALATSTVHDAMTTTTTRRNTSPSAQAVANDDDFDRTVGWRRLKSPGVTVALLAMMIAAILQSLGTVVIGRLATNPIWTTVGVLAACLLGAAVLDTLGRTVWARIADRAEGRLRADLLTAALSQPLEKLSE